MAAQILEEYEEDGLWEKLDDEQYDEVLDVIFDLEDTMKSTLLDDHPDPHECKCCVISVEVYFQSSLLSPKCSVRVTLSNLSYVLIMFMYVYIYTSPVQP